MIFHRNPDRRYGHFMITIRKANERWHSNFGWLDAYHTSGFEGHFDKNGMGFRKLRIINDDLVMPGHGLGLHPHKNMEIITYVLAGEVEHKDSMSIEGEVVINGKALIPGDGAALEKESKLQISAVKQSQVLLFDFN